MPFGSRAPSASVTLLVTIGPVETAAIFVALTATAHRPDRMNLALRPVTIAGPGNLSAIVLVMGRSGSLAQGALALVTLVVCLVLTCVAMRLA